MTLPRRRCPPAPVAASVVSCSQFLLEMRRRFDQFACVSSLWVAEHRPALAPLNDAAVAQNDGVIAHHANHVEVV
jgi:hypothetical protein